MVILTLNIAPFGYFWAKSTSVGMIDDVDIDDRMVVGAGDRESVFMVQAMMRAAAEKLLCITPAGRC